MSSRAFDFTGISAASLRGGEDSNNTAVIVLTVVVIVLIVVVLAGCGVCCSSNSTSGGGDTTSMGARISRTFKPKSRLAHPQPMHHAARPRRFEGYPPATMPAGQLMSQTDMAGGGDPGLDYVLSASGAIGESTDRSTTEVGGTSANTYLDTSYSMASGMMTPSSATDIKGLDTFMPMMSDGVGTAGGPVDPSTGLPLFTTGKLVRSQMLGGHGAGSFLRQQQDPLSGYKRLGKNMCGAQNARHDLSVRRAQFNAARLADPNGDPVLFQTSEFAYY